MFVRQHKNGNWYVFRRTHAGKKNPNGKSTERDWFIIKANSSSQSIFIDKHTAINFTQPFFGKKVRLKVEVI